MIGFDVMIGNHSKIQNNVFIQKAVTLEDEVSCGLSYVFTNVYNPRAFIDKKHEFKQTIAERGATAEATATVICVVTIGRYAIMGVGALLKSGVPANQTGRACTRGRTLKLINKYTTCDYSRSAHRLENHRSVPIKHKHQLNETNANA